MVFMLEMRSFQEGFEGDLTAAFQYLQGGY